MQARAAKSPVYVSDENGSPPFVATFDGDWREVAGPLILNPLRLKCGWAFLRWHMQVRWRKMSGHGQKSLSPRSRPLCVDVTSFFSSPLVPLSPPPPTLSQRPHPLVHGGDSGDLEALILKSRELPATPGLCSSLPFHRAHRFSPTQAGSPSWLWLRVPSTFSGTWGLWSSPSPAPPPLHVSTAQR